MVVTLSSKGQLVIPKNVREILGLESGSQLNLSFDGGKITLEPFQEDEVIDLLYGMFSGENLLDELEDEHRLELDGDKQWP
ncbi:MAG: AbrB/MazE/SpoVT family DNA-binding domain-containing protein [Caldilineaceae bacterium]|nr:AbrB/MazE/SpoVT family DNA-binding domain-containing protein [Caldilineaceae bacterium]